MGVGGFGVDDVEEALAEVAQSDGVEVCGLGHEVAFGLCREVGVEVVGEVLDGADDHPGLVDQQVPGSQRVSHRGVPVGEAGGQLGLAVGLAAGHPGLVGPPDRHRGGPDLLGDPHGPGVRSEAGFELGQPGPGAGEPDQHLSGLRGVHRPQGGVGDLVEGGFELGDRARHLVSWVRLCGHRHSREVKVVATVYRTGVRAVKILKVKTSVKSSVDANFRESAAKEPAGSSDSKPPYPRSCRRPPLQTTRRPTEMSPVVSRRLLAQPPQPPCEAAAGKPASDRDQSRPPLCCQTTTTRASPQADERSRGGSLRDGSP